MRHEQQMQNMQRQNRQLALQWEELNRVYEERSNEYCATLPRAQLQQYDDSVNEDRVDQYFTSTTCDRSRRTIPTTYEETDQFSQNV